MSAGHYDDADVDDDDDDDYADNGDYDDDDDDDVRGQLNREESINLKLMNILGWVTHTHISPGVSRCCSPLSHHSNWSHPELCLGGGALNTTR